MIDNKRIGRSIRKLREKAHMTQKELADLLFVSDMAVSKWETGKSIPDVSTLKKLSVLLDMDVDGLLDGTAASADVSWAGILTVGSENISVILYDKPLIDYLLSYFMLAGIDRIIIVGTEANQAFIRKRFQNGSPLGLHLLLVSDIREIHYSADNFMLINAPVFIYGVNLTRFLQRAMNNRSGFVNMAWVVGENGKTLGKMKTGAWRDGNLKNNYAYHSTPIYFFSGGQMRFSGEGLVFPTVDSVMEPMDKGFIVSAVDMDEKREEVSNLVRMIQGLTGFVIYCPFEIAWRRGLISKEKMIKEGGLFPEYAEYLNRL